jgi:hypothetical protein
MHAHVWPRMMSTSHFTENLPRLHNQCAELPGCEQVQVRAWCIEEIAKMNLQTTSMSTLTAMEMPDWF